MTSTGSSNVAVATVTAVKAGGDRPAEVVTQVSSKSQQQLLALHSHSCSGGASSSLASAVFGNTLKPPTPSSTSNPSSVVHYTRRRSSPCTRLVPKSSHHHPAVESVAIISKGDHHGQILHQYGNPSNDPFFDTVSCGGSESKKSLFITSASSAKGGVNQSLLANGPLAVEGRWRCNRRQTFVEEVFAWKESLFSRLFFFLYKWEKHHLYIGNFFMLHTRPLILICFKLFCSLKKRAIIESLQAIKCCSLFMCF